MLQKASASILLAVMSLLIGLQAPMLGFCQHSQTFFIVDEPTCETAQHPGHHHHHHDGHHHHHHGEPEQKKQPEPAQKPAPCDHGHQLITLDIGDFTWSSTSAPHEAKLHPTHLHFPANHLLPAPQQKIERKKIPRAPPPPPRAPHFPLHSIWRL